MAIWFDDYHKFKDISILNNMSKDTLMEHLDILFTGIGPDFLTATMPVDHRTFQPFKQLHGGASVALAESLGSSAANMCIDITKQYCVGLEINTNHVRAVYTGHVTGVAKPIHLGSKTHVWDIKIYDDKDKLTSISRITMAVLDRS